MTLDEAGQLVNLLYGSEMCSEPNICLLFYFFVAKHLQSFLMMLFRLVGVYVLRFGT